MTLKHHGSGLADLENAMEYNNFFTVKEQRWTKKILILLQLWISYCHNCKICSRKYKYLYFKDILDFYELDENLKAHKKEQAKRPPRRAAGVAYGNPAHMRDAAQYIKLAWDAISGATIKNTFNITELVTLKGGAYEEVDMMANPLCSFKALNIPIGESTLDEFVHVYDKKSEEFLHEILDDANEVLESIQATNDNKDENVHTVVKSCAHSSASTETCHFLWV